MAQTSPMEPFDRGNVAAADYRQQSREFLSKGPQYLADGDLYQASEKGWGAAAWMAKAVAEAQGWEYRRHDEFFKVMQQARQLSGDTRLRRLRDAGCGMRDAGCGMRDAANTLHGYFYTRKMLLDPNDIDEGLDDMATLLDILQPLTEVEANSR